MNMKVIYLETVSRVPVEAGKEPRFTFIPYCNFATAGLSEMNVKSFRFIL